LKVHKDTDITDEGGMKRETAFGNCPSVTDTGFGETLNGHNNYGETLTFSDSQEQALAI
jgi:hypothetical protein